MFFQVELKPSTDGILLPPPPRQNYLLHIKAMNAKKIKQWTLRTNLPTVVVIIFALRLLAGSTFLSDGEWDVMQTLLTTPLTVAVAIIILNTFKDVSDESSEIARKGGIAILSLINWPAFIEALNNVKLTQDNIIRVVLYLCIIFASTYYLDTRA